MEALATQVHATKASIGNFENGNSKPSLDALISLADYFNVSIDYLAGRSASPDMIDPQNGAVVPSDEARRFALAYDAASEKDKTIIRTVLGL